MSILQFVRDWTAHIRDDDSSRGLLKLGPEFPESKAAKALREEGLGKLLFKPNYLLEETEMKIEINGEQVDLKGARTPEGIAEVVRQRVIELGGDPTTIYPFSIGDEAPSDDPTRVTLVTSFNKAAQR